MNKKKLIIIIFILTLMSTFVGIAVYAQLKSKGSNSSSPKGSAPVSVEPVVKKTIVTKVKAKGKVVLKKKEILYSETQAKIEYIAVEAGDKVSVGQALVKYDDKALDDLKEQLNQANLALESSQLALTSAKLPINDITTTSSETQIVQAEQAIKDLDYKIYQFDITISNLESKIADSRANFESKKMLYENGVISKTDLDKEKDALTKLEEELKNTQIQKDNTVSSKSTAEQNLNLSKQQHNETIEKNKKQQATNSNNISVQQVAVEQAQAKVKQTQKKIDEFKLEEISPINGTVLSITGVEGSMASSATPILEIGEISNQNMLLQLEVPENKASEIKTGQKAEISGNVLGNKKYPGVVEKMLPKAEQRQIGTSTETVVLVNIRATGESFPALPGNNLTADITVDTAENVLVVPLVSTFKDEDGKDYVFIAKDDYKCEKRIIELGSYSGVQIEATNVSEGEKVIIDPPKTLKDGDFVEVIELGKKTDPKTSKPPANN